MLDYVFLVQLLGPGMFLLQGQNICQRMLLGHCDLYTYSRTSRLWIECTLQCGRRFNDHRNKLQPLKAHKSRQAKTAQQLVLLIYIIYNNNGMLTKSLLILLKVLYSFWTSSKRPSTVLLRLLAASFCSGSNCSMYPYLRVGSHKSPSTSLATIT